MSMNKLQSDLLQLLSLGKDNQNSIIKRLDKLIREYGTRQIVKWRNLTNDTQNTLLHELVEKELLDVIRYVVTEYKFDINIQRNSDGWTPFQVASKNQNFEICNLLKELGASENLSEDISKWLSEDDKIKSMNIVWVDLEMTSIEDPEIMECAVIITDKDLNELERANWVIHFDQSVLETLGSWHQKTFADIDDSGNGLLADALKSTNTKEQVEDELLALIKRHCPPKQCPLGGSSIHIDKHVLYLRMPKVHDYLHYRIIDVTSFQGIMRRWAPWIEADIKKRLARKGQETVNHRAMDDIEWSIAFMREFRPVLARPRNDVNNRKNERPMLQQQQQNQRRRSASPPLIQRNQPPPRNNYADNKVQLYADEKRLLERLDFERTFVVRDLNLSKEDQNLYDTNPHLREIFINREHLARHTKEFTIKNRFLKLPCKSSSSKIFDARRITTTEHWGQRKLLLAEIEFLTNYGADTKYLVVYAGATPGSHINYLSSLFPNLQFLLFEENQLSVTETNKIQIAQKALTNERAKHLYDTKQHILFICNVRTFNSHGNVDNDITNDMLNQLEWHKIIKPDASLLNFRLPRVPGKTQYFKGDLVIEPWASKRSTECRLIVDQDCKLINYDHLEFEHALLDFHNERRIRYYNHNMDEVNNEGLDHCYDCRSEIFIIQEYLTKVKMINNEKELKSSTAAMSAEISRKIVDERRKSVIGTLRTLDVVAKRPMVISNIVRINFPKNT